MRFENSAKRVSKYKTITILYFIFAIKRNLMYKKIALLSLLILTFSCKQETDKESFSITVSLDEKANNSLASLFRVDNKKKNVIDSAVVNNGQLRFKGSVSAPDKYYIIIEDVLGNFPLILANEKFNIEMRTDSLAASKISGSKENEYTAIYTEEAKYLRDAYYNLDDKFKAFRIKNDSTGMTAIKKSYDSLVNEALLFDIKFIKKHPNAALSALSLERITKAKQIDSEKFNTLKALLNQDLMKTRAIKETIEFLEKDKLRQE